MVILFSICTIIVLFTKYYVLIAFLAAALVYGTIEIKDKIKKRIAFVSLGILTLVLLFVAPYVSSKFDAVNILNNKREEALKAAIFGEAKQLTFEDLIDGGLPGLIQESPKAIFAALYRPFITEK